MPDIVRTIVVHTEDTRDREIVEHLVEIEMARALHYRFGDYEIQRPDGTVVQYDPKAHDGGVRPLAERHSIPVEISEALDEALVDDFEGKVLMSATPHDKEWWEELALQIKENPDGTFRGTHDD